MGRSRVEKAATHRRIVAVAVRRLRERGLDGIGVAEVMREAGLTAGGFYRHFRSRDDLVAEALASAAAGPGDPWDGAPDLRGFLEAYLCEGHRDAPGSGCTLGALLSEVARGGAEARGAFTAGVEREIGALSFVGGRDAAHRRARAILVLASCLGAIGLSRAVSDPDLSGEVLRAVGDQLIELMGRIAE